MRELEIARRLSELCQPEEAVKAYKLVMELAGASDPEVSMEAASYILQYGSGEDYKISYTAFRDLYNGGVMKNSILEIMRAAFYEPNGKLLRARYKNNCKLLMKYPYIFRKDFPRFEDLTIQFFPYDDNSYTPFYPKKEVFGDYINPKNPVISRNFFKDLEKPVLASDVYSQYELEYLNDNVRKSEHIGRENHIYLHYSDWEVFCSYLQCLDMNTLLGAKKIIFLFEDELSQYPIDFNQKFGIDYSKYPVRPLGIRDVNRLIWHTQLSSHNGGDFFNEIFDDHPNLLTMPSIMFDNAEETSKNILDAIRKCGDLQTALLTFSEWDAPRLIEEFFRLRNRTMKDALVLLYLRDKEKTSPNLDESSRIAPALFFQPHFYNMVYSLKVDDKDRAVLFSEQYEAICSSPLFKNFKYIKTFTPMRRITNSHAATVRFMYNNSVDEKNDREKDTSVIVDAVVNRVLNRSYMVDWQDRLFKDCVLVRFEDGKLNPKATFTALAAFLDLPYTESLTYCSEWGKRDPVTEGNVVGFDTATVYREYDEFANDNERLFIEYFMRDAYEFYGYDFNYYGGEAMDAERVYSIIENFQTIDGLIFESWKKMFLKSSGLLVKKMTDVAEDSREAAEHLTAEQLAAGYVKRVQQLRKKVTDDLLEEFTFVNRNCQPLKFMPKLQLNPELLEQPLYH